MTKQTRDGIHSLARGLPQGTEKLSEPCGSMGAEVTLGPPSRQQSRGPEASVYLELDPSSRWTWKAWPPAPGETVAVRTELMQLGC